MQQSLVHFLNHGLLPFVGRREQVDRIELFWRQTTESHGLRALLLVGEAGVGKSRLVEEVIPRVGAAGGAVIHAKLYPDSTSSVAPLFVRALGRSSVAQSLLKSEPPETLPGVISALVRICGLRPTLLVIEDIHLLQGDALREFSAFLDHLSDEPLSILCAARPVDLAARGTLERFLVDEIELPGLTSAEIADLCYKVIGQDVGAELATLLEQKTCGNALALRSALRGALKPGPAPPGRSTKGAPVWGRVDRANLAESLERNVRLLSEGMAAHLTPEERTAGEQIAALGEVFARETAMAILEPSDRAERLLSQLLFKGIITTAVSTTAALDRFSSSSAPLSFTHSLLHRYFIEHGSIDAATLVRVVAADLPLYSVVPFQRLAELECLPSPGAGLERKVFDRALDMGAELRSGVDWRFEEIVLKGAGRILDACCSEWSEEERLLMRVRLRKAEGYVFRHVLPLIELRDYYLVLLEMTEDERFTSLRIYRLHALRRLYWFESFHRFAEEMGPEDMVRRMEEIREYVERYPELMTTREYADHLCDSAMISARGDGPPLAQVELDFDRLLETLGSDTEMSTYARVMILPHFLGLYSTPEELAARARTLAEIEELVSGGNDVALENFIFPQLNHLNGTLRIDELLDATAVAIRRASARSTWARMVPYRMLQMYGRLMRDLDFERAANDADDILAAIPPIAGRREIYAPQVFGYICNSAIIAHDDAAIIAALERFPCDPEELTQGFILILALATGDLHEAVRKMNPADERDQIAHDMALLVLGEIDPTERDATLRRAVDALDEPIISSDRLMFHSYLIRLLVMTPESAGEGKMGAAVVAAIRQELNAALEFLAERELYKVIARMLEKFALFFSKTELAAWKGRYADILKRRGVDTGGEGEQAKIRVSMFGAVTVQKPGEDPERVKGAQICTLLGLMVADQLQESPLSQREFMALAIGSDRDPDSARKSLNFAVFRLREILGNPLAIDTGGETPKLARDLVDVDFIEASEALERARGALSEGALMRAVPDLLDALRIGAGRVAYPALYEEFFEAGREDYETTLRRVVLGVGRALMREGDNTSAAEVLSRAYEAMPDDVELGELLQQVLIRQGKRARAARISLRVAEEA